MKHDFSLSLKDRLKLLLERALLKLASEIKLDPNSLQKVRESIAALELESIREESFGDYACTAAMEKNFREFYAQAHTEYRNPRNFALAICAKLKEDKESQENLESIEVAGPGFINLTLHKAMLGEYIIQMRAEREKLLLLAQEKRQKIIFEYVSANPTGPLNVVSARAASLGDACAQLCKAVGHEVTREYYVNDHGNQIILLGQSVLLRYLESCGGLLKFAEQNDSGKLVYPNTPGLPFPKEAYHGEYIKGLVQDLQKTKIFSELTKEKIEELKKLSHEKEPDKNLESQALQSFLSTEEMLSLTQKLGHKAAAFLLEEQKESLKSFRVSFDNYFHESLLHDKEKLKEIQKKMAKEGLCYQKDGAIFFRSTQYGDDKDRVLVRQDGRPSYFLSDITYHADKIERGFKHIYNIWGPDHHGYIARLRGAVQAIGYKGIFKLIIAQQVNLLKAGKALRMSKRAGRTLSLRELLEEVPVDVARYFFVMRSFSAPMDFDLAAAKDNSEKNPYYYVAYAHARICSIFRKAQEKKLSPLSNQKLRALFASSEENLSCEESASPPKANASSNTETSQSWQWSPQRRRLLLQTARFMEEIQAAAEALEPHRLVNYLYTLAVFLSQFYGPQENRIIQQDPRLAGGLLAILEAVAFCLKKGLNLLGTEAPERLLRADDETEKGKDRKQKN